MVACIIDIFNKTKKLLSKYFAYIWLQPEIEYLLSTQEKELSGIIHILSQEGTPKDDILKITQIALYPIREDENGKLVILFKDYQTFQLIFSDEILGKLIPYEYLTIYEVETKSSTEYFVERMRIDALGYEYYHIDFFDYNLIGEYNRSSTVEYENGKFIRLVDKPILRSYINECGKKRIKAFNYIISNNL